MNESTHSERPERPLLSIVLPMFNEVQVISELIEAIDRSVNQCDVEYEVVCINDGSTDRTGAALDKLAESKKYVRVLHLARNFGHQAAVQAGLVHACGDIVVVMDADMQDDPAGIPLFIDKWREGFDVVYAIRVRRKESIIKRGLFIAFYRLLNTISSTPIPLDAGNFGLLDRRVVDSVVSLQDHDRYYPGLRQWVGFSQVGIKVERGERYDNMPRVSIGALWRLAKTAIFSFSSFPLTIFYGIALISVVVCIGLICFSVYYRLATDLAIPGWTSILTTASFFGALNALGIAILGEYVLRIYDQVRGRPVYLVERTTNLSDTSPVRLDSQSN